MQAHCEAAAAEGVELAVFPEAYVGGYPKGLDFGARIGTRSPEGREDFLRYWQAAIEVPGPEVARIGGFAAKMRAHLVVGVIERDGATLYCSALFFGPDGALLGKHRKLMPTASERLVWGQGDGSTLPAIDTPMGRMGAAICWENYMPSLRQAMYAKGVSLWCAPTVDEREIWQASMRHIAYEGRTFVLSACQYLTRADAPADYACIQGDDPKTELIRGGSVIVSPLGEILAGPVYGREVVLTADIDPMDAIRGKYDLDVAGHYARPDVFTLGVDERPRAAVTTDPAVEIQGLGQD
jgi:nitrilase